MTLEEMLKRKRELGLTYADISEKSGVPLPTVQKILGGRTKSPGYLSLRAIETALEKESGAEKKSGYPEGAFPGSSLRESPAAFGSFISGSSAEKNRDSYPLLPYKRQGEYTAADRDALPADVRTELIDGVLYDLASPLNPHQIVVGELHLLLKECISKYGEKCYVFLSPSDVWLTGDDRNIFQPDLYVICDYSMLQKDGHTKGAPPFIIEVLSASTSSRDFLLKTYKYCRAGVKEYWIVDPGRKRVCVYDFEKDPFGTERMDYDFSAQVPIALSRGKCSIDFRKVEQALKMLGYDNDPASLKSE